MSKHSPAPWTFDRERDQVIAANGSLVCKIATGEDRNEEDANAYLITALPDLLAALRDIADADYGTDTPKLRERARTAIAKHGGAP